MNGSANVCSMLLLNEVSGMPFRLKEGLLGDSDGLLLLFMLLLFGMAIAFRLIPGLLGELSFSFTEKGCDFSRLIRVNQGVLICLSVISLFLLSFFLSLFYSVAVAGRLPDTLHVLKFTAVFALPLLLYFLYKGGFNFLFVWTFYSRGFFNYWAQCSLGIYLLVAIALLPLLFISLLLYGNELHIMLYIMLFVSLFAVLVMMVRSYFIFFRNIKGGLYFILYLCAQEICPLLLLGQAMDFFYNYYI